VLGTASHWDGILCVLILDAGRWISLSKRSPSDMPLYSALPRLFFSFFSTPSCALPSSWVPASSRIPSVQSEALGGGGKVDGWRGRMGAVGEEGAPRERDSATCRKEAPRGALRMLQCLVGVPSGVSFLPLAIQFHVKLLSFRLENWVEFHSESFFRKYTVHHLSIIVYSPPYRQTPTPPHPHLISTRLDSLSSAPRLHRLHLALSISAHFS
jgi:hypothetical protein